MLGYKLRITEKQRHVNRKNLRQRIVNHDGESFEITGTHDDIVNKFGQVLTKDGRHIIVLKGVVYRIVFKENVATIYVKPYDVDTPLVS